ncbi:hypothetical protein [Actinomadura bangladeshensis]|uniref:Uncharacterized protein n=1 Tax=Actinomadura bangladeshensis TaxID=453573 RepID=A0A4R4P7S9_9ACTN|nr:hypothetical protein [Actinomadura bangladeshensis]TDC18215.1 hypothetical protein E1284_07050 [Actinomadura bangladeshensis]
MRSRDPGEKKRLSYAKDRRNAYAENDKSSRNAVRLNKRFPNRANRHRLQRILRDATGSPDAGRAGEVEERLARRRPKTWRKEPGLPLGDWVESRLQRRLRREGGGSVDEQRLARVERRRSHRAKLRSLTRAQVATEGTVERRW